ncbi:dTDP-4-keto-6-deoxy-D-glucose epimerase [Campylobacter coli]|nr:dTDP-4-keto-6-deoxy-D-glucose epimerase [Campylobacter coli]
MFNKIETHIENLWILQPIIYEDARGKFVKSFSKNNFGGLNLDYDFKEMYYSISHKGVFRGMHFQIPPYDHAKLVFVSSGKILDIVLDLRKRSKSYGKYFSHLIDGIKREILYIPKGCAHGFLYLQDNSIVNYMQTSVYSEKHDFGVLYDSFGFDFPLSKFNINKMIISQRDLSFKTFEEISTLNFF